jgi:hypothetical protein
MIHSFFRTIGFSKLVTNTELYGILESVVNHPDEQSMIQDKNGNEFACFSKNMGGDFGVCVCGNFLNDNEFRMEYYYPYFRGSQITTYEPIELEKHASKEAFAGICDEIKLGVTLIFYIENIMDVLRERKISGNRPVIGSAVLSGLSVAGKILLPVMKTSQQLKKKEKSSEKRLSLMQQAREGDRGAIENLTLNDMDTYSSLSRRVAREDVLTIVESSFIPYGIESDQYIIIGEILNFYKVQNKLTNENVWILSINCNGLTFDVCINECDLYGEPEIGRRFKGRIWMQGHLNFGY